MGKGKKKSKSVAAARLKAQVELIEAAGDQINSGLSILCNSIVQARKADMEGLESQHKAQVLMHEGTTSREIIESNLETLETVFQASFPLVSVYAERFLSLAEKQAEAESTNAQAQLEYAQAALLTAQARKEEARIKAMNARTERMKAEKLRSPLEEVELEAERERSKSRRKAAAEAQWGGGGPDDEEVWGRSGS